MKLTKKSAVFVLLGCVVLFGIAVGIRIGPQLKRTMISDWTLRVDDTHSFIRIDGEEPVFAGRLGKIIMPASSGRFTGAKVLAYRLDGDSIHLLVRCTPEAICDVAIDLSQPLPFFEPESAFTVSESPDTSWFRWTYLTF